jgi:ketosteroid isomerase-like protein
MNSDERKEKAKQLLKACDMGDAEAAEKLINDDFTFQFMEKADTWTVDGQEVSTRLDKPTFLNYGLGAAEQVTSNKRFNFGFDLAVNEGDHVMILGTSDARSLKGDPYRNNYVWYVRFSGEGISELREYCDTKHAHDVLFD